MGAYKPRPPTYSCNESKYRNGRERGPNCYSNDGVPEPGHHVSGRLVARLDASNERLGGTTSACFDAVVKAYDPRTGDVQLTQIVFRSAASSRGLRIPQEFHASQLSWNPHKD